MVGLGFRLGRVSFGRNVVFGFRKYLCVLGIVVCILYVRFYVIFINIFVMCIAGVVSVGSFRCFSWWVKGKVFRVTRIFGNCIGSFFVREGYFIKCYIVSILIMLL